ncbi:MAG TPA: 4-hydroxy-3-methylbut-2-enyl diphosphate reductase [Oligoflexia bacterium]|nr:4-hydroxy-3-methylbut-2-enyl diphosphate reductase [Oligoflexia bacterium]HMP49310.1 4-hydroxy-3-methylbut-2-enyl diphosphate reductase [Oligoflexia bacterium]
MARTFNVPTFYRSSLVTSIKKSRGDKDPKKKDQSPSVLEFDGLRFHLARHFGFCFGVENAIETAYRVVEENPGKRIFLLSEMIHNPKVNKDLWERGVSFLMKTDGTRLIDFKSLNSDDIVIVPAFGTTLEIIEELNELGLNPLAYNATCPFVEKVWKRSFELGQNGFTIIIHGKKNHEETRATFSHARVSAPSVIIKDLNEAKIVSEFIKGKISSEQFMAIFSDCVSQGFDPKRDLSRVGVVNQTTMLASETAEIASHFKTTMEEVYGKENLSTHYADTRDTLCYATYENQSAALALREIPADLGLVVGGYNSSNTSHLAELLLESYPTYFIQDADEIISLDEIRHYDLHENKVTIKNKWFPELKDKSDPVVIAITAGASCPDKTVQEVITRVKELYS